MTSALATTLGSLARRTPSGLVAEPKDERGLVELLHVLANEGAQLHRDVKLSRARFDQIGRVEPKSMSVTAGAGVVLRTLDEKLRMYGLTVGPLTPAAMSLTLGELLEGPYAGMRAIPGGRLEPICTRVVGYFADGRRLETSAAPRSAAGPDLTALFLGGHGRLALVASAVIRCFPLPESDVRFTWSFPSAQSCVSALTRAIAAGCLPWRVHADARSGRVVVEARWAGTVGGVERDRELLDRCIDDAGGRPAGDAEREPPVSVEHESTWDAVRASLERKTALQLFRLSLTSVVARGDVEGVPLDEPGAWSSLGGRLLALDPRRVLGGAP